MSSRAVNRARVALLAVSHRVDDTYQGPCPLCYRSSSPAAAQLRGGHRADVRRDRRVVGDPAGFGALTNRHDLR